MPTKEMASRTALSTRRPISCPCPRCGPTCFPMSLAVRTHWRSERPSNFTFAPEAGSSGCATVINKNITEADIVSTARQAFASKVKSVKLYFMIGLPTETGEDLDELVALVEKVTATAPRGAVRSTSRFPCFLPRPTPRSSGRGRSAARRSNATSTWGTSYADWA